MAKNLPAERDRGTVTVRVPMTFRRRGGRKALVAIDGGPRFVRTGGRVDSTLVKAIARAYRWQKLIETGAYGSIQEIAAAENINASYVGRVLRLTLLAPNIIEAVLDGSRKHELQLQRLMAPFPVEWEAQHELVAR